VSIELIGVPFDGFGRRGHQARAAGALRRAGLEAAFGSRELRRSPDLDLPSPTPERAPCSGVMNEPALVAMVDGVNERVRRALGASRFPVVYGGDCAVLLGAVTALRDVAHVAGLVFVDGHEDTTPLDVSTDGEAANMEIGLLLGITGRLAPSELRRRLPALTPETLAMLGPRDHGLRRRANLGTLADAGVFYRSAQAAVADPRRSAIEATTVIRRRTASWWLHVDLDVLRQDVLIAQRVPGDHDESGGLDWPQLTELVSAALAEEGCRGMSLTIYDPEQDPGGREAEAIVAFVGAAFSDLR
jgi:arginase